MNWACKCNHIYIPSHPPLAPTAAPPASGHWTNPLNSSLAQKKSYYTAGVWINSELIAGLRCKSRDNIWLQGRWLGKEPLRSPNSGCTVPQEQPWQRQQDDRLPLPIPALTFKCKQMLRKENRELFKNKYSCSPLHVIKPVFLYQRIY